MNQKQLDKLEAYNEYMEHLNEFKGLYDSKKQILNHIYNLIESIKKRIRI